MEQVLTHHFLKSRRLLTVKVLLWKVHLPPYLQLKRIWHNLERTLLVSTLIRKPARCSATWTTCWVKTASSADHFHRYRWHLARTLLSLSRSPPQSHLIPVQYAKTRSNLWTRMSNQRSKLISCLIDFLTKPWRTMKKIGTPQRELKTTTINFQTSCTASLVKSG